MRSQLDVRLGAAEPQILHLPPDVHSLAAAEETIELANAYGVCSGSPLSPGQECTLRAALGERADGTWAATTVADFKGRQGGGKTDTIIARELAGLILFGEQLIIHTAHEFPTANESFLRLVSVFENWDDLRKKVARIRYANGEQGIELLSGQRLKYKARTGGSGRGFAKADLMVYDEAQHLQAEHVAASAPARLANPNSQSWYAGSGGLSTSTVAWRIRKRAISGDGGRLAYTENTAERVSWADGRVVTVAPDPHDRDGWAKANPGMNRWVPEEALEGLFAELGPDLFARECLCVWEPDPSDMTEEALPGWVSLADAESQIVGALALAVDVSPDRRFTSIAAAGKTADGRTHVELIERQIGTGNAVQRLAELRERWMPVALVLDPAGPAGSLLAELQQAGMEPRSITFREHGQACGMLWDDVAEKRVVHLGDPVLNAAVHGARRRLVGDAWLWDRKKSDVDISPLVAVTLARWAHAAAVQPAAPAPVFAY